MLFKVFQSFVKSFLFRDISGSKIKKIIWGHSETLEYGPGVRTRRLRDSLKNIKLHKHIIYMQSHWPWYEILFYSISSKIYQTPIIFNQNGIYKKSYKSTYWLNNIIILIGLFSADYIVYQSFFCKESVKSITPRLIWPLLLKKKSKRILNPSPYEFFDENLNSNSHNIVISNAFGEDRLYYCEYLLDLFPTLSIREDIKTISIVGPFLSSINKNELLKAKFNSLFDSFTAEEASKIIFHGYLNQFDLRKVLKDSTLAIHLNYADPAPNMVAEFIAFSIPLIVNIFGGSKEIAGEACMFTRNELKYQENYMPDIKNVLSLLDSIIYDYKSFKDKAIVQARKLSIDNYTRLHLDIIEQL